MAFIGNTPDQQAFTPAVDFFNGNGSTTAFTLSKPVASVAQVQAVISNVPQKPGDAFTVSGNTITFTSAPPSGTQNIYVYYTSPITQVIAPGQGTVGTAQLQDGAVITQDIADGAVTTAKLASGAATGSKLGSDVVVTSGNQTIAGTKTFSNGQQFNSGIGVGGAGPDVSGVRFPTTQVASSDANTLDDYEEGTWTPSVNLLGTLNYTGYRTGYYTKIGKRVFVTFMVGLSSSDTTQDSNQLRISGLPFTSANVGDYWTQGSVAISSERYRVRQSSTATGATIAVSVIPNTSDLMVIEVNYNGTLAYQTYMTNALRSGYTGSNMYFAGQISYEVA